MLKKNRKLYHCKFCGVDFYGFIYKERVFCSRECRYEWQKENLKGVNNPNYGNFMDDELKKIISKKCKEHISKNGHPKGMLGKKHSDKTKEIMSEKELGQNNSMWGKKHKESSKKLMSNKRRELMKNGWKPTIRSVLPLRDDWKDNIRKGTIKRIKFNKNFVKKRITKKFNGYRSENEVKIAKFLNNQKIKFEYEKKVFFLEDEDGKEIIYCPDFYLIDYDIWLEGKNRIRKNKKFDLFNKNYNNSFMVSANNFKEEINNIIKNANKIN